MKRERKMFKKIIVLLVCSICLLACNSGENPENNNNDSYFGSLFGNNPGEELSTTAEDVSSGLGRLVEEGKLQNNQEVQDFYESRNHTAAWNSPDYRIDFYSQLERADEEGLFTEDYHAEDLKRLMDNPAGSPKDELATLEILLTDAFIEYAHDLYYGKLDPGGMYEVWGVDKEPKDLVDLLKTAVDQGEIANVLEDLKPAHQVYKDLKKSLQEYGELKEGEAPFTKIQEGELIKPGDKDERIKAVTERLKQLELLEQNYSPSGNVYDEKLQAGIRDFQKSKGLEIDRVLGNSTIRQLNMSAGERYDQILANLERWRWYPRDLGEHYILINIPAFKLAVVKDGDTVRTHNVIAGTKERATPVFSDTLQYIVINPEWHIPPTIKTKDVIPAASKDRSYLRNNNITVMSADGETIDPSQIDWSGDEVQKYRFVQKAGPSNPLGKVKIIYPNEHAIYLHDTPGKALFEQNERAESSGCVRVEDVIELAAYVVNENLDQEKIEEIIASGETTQVETKSPIQVHHFYWTAWRDNGKTVFTDDVYRLDREISAALKDN